MTSLHNALRRRIPHYLLSACVACLATTIGVVVWELAGDESFLTGSAPWLHIRHAHGFSYAHMPSLANKTAVVTGASSGLGLLAYAHYAYLLPYVADISGFTLLLAGCEHGAQRCQGEC